MTDQNLAIVSDRGEHCSERNPVYLLWRAYQRGNPKDALFGDSVMKIRGDTLSSFAVAEWQGQVWLYRRPDAIVRVGDQQQMAGRTFFQGWSWDGSGLHRASHEKNVELYYALYE